MSNQHGALKISHPWTQECLPIPVFQLLFLQNKRSWMKRIYFQWHAGPVSGCNTSIQNKELLKGSRMACFFFLSLDWDWPILLLLWVDFTRFSRWPTNPHKPAHKLPITPHWATSALIIVHHWRLNCPHRVRANRIFRNLIFYSTNLKYKYHIPGY